MMALDELTAEEKNVFRVLGVYSQEDECHLQNWEIARLCGIKRYRISKILKALEEKKLIKRHTHVVAPPLWNQDKVRAERMIELKRGSR